MSAIEMISIPKQKYDEMVDCVNRHANAERLVAWVKDRNREPSMIAFTEGPDRQVAYAVEHQLTRLSGKTNYCPSCERYAKDIERLAHEVQGLRRVLVLIGDLSREKLRGS